MPTTKKVPRLPSVLKDITVTPRDRKIIGKVVPSWSVLNKILIDQPNRLLMAKKALLMELGGKRREYECTRLMRHIMQCQIEGIRETGMKELERCLKKKCLNTNVIKKSMH